MDEERPRVLIVVVPGFVPEMDQWEEMGKRLRETEAVARWSHIAWCVYPHRLTLFTRGSLTVNARDLSAWITQQWVEAGEPEDVILAGHSAGALIVRQAWLNAADDTQRDYCSEPWSGRVRRFVLFAGVSRGIDPTGRPWRTLLARVAELIPGSFRWEDCLRGSRMITNLRISWIRYVESLRDGAPEMVQLLGTQDDWVEREDSLDLDVLPSSRVVSVAGAAHGDLHHLKELDTAAARGRLARFAEAFAGPLSPRKVDPGASKSKKDVLMIVHGIRASSVDDWVRQAKDKAEVLWPEAIVATPTYGYLSALRFALPNVRRRYGRYFRDFYTQLIATHRSPQISVLCHSNGTYALGKCLADFNAIRVHRVALAGSVLPPNFAWDSLREANRVTDVRNDGGDQDVPVAILCSALRALRMRDVGTGGFDGFIGGGVQEVRYHRGGHGSMLTPENLESMIRFLKGESPPRPVTSEGGAWMGRLSRLMTYVAPAIALALVAGLVLLAVYTPGGALAAVLVLLLIWIVLDTL